MRRIKTNLKLISNCISAHGNSCGFAMNCSVVKQRESRVKLLSDRIGKLECGLTSCNAKASSITVTPAPSAATPKEPVKADTVDKDDDDDVDLFGVCCHR